MPDEVAEILLEPRVLYARVCQMPDCQLVYQTEWVERSWETTNEVVSHGICASCLREHYPEEAP